ncbi:SDR family oxidoreductase [Sorangium sp. KYC3313]|uniref:SDR family oxidoreductase n=1 Tax=Sorangium sp. KYC3313 TaxID=3449740 RepID=UPI003F88FC9C
MAEAAGHKTVLITGAAKRLGRATALAFAAEGVSVVVHYNRSAGEAEDLCHDLLRPGVRAWPIRADLSDPGEAGGLIERALQIAGTLDVLVNNASIFPHERFSELTLEGFLTSLRVNAWAPLVLCREFARRVGSGRGNVVNLLDTRIDGYDPSHVGYLLSKHVLAVLTRMAAVELAPGVTVNGVAPGAMLPPPGETAAYIDRLAEHLPLKRHGRPEDVAEAVVALAKSSFITGEIVHVDGGQHLVSERSWTGS